MRSTRLQTRSASSRISRVSALSCAGAFSSSNCAAPRIPAIGFLTSCAMAAAISRCAGRGVKPEILTASGPPSSSASAQDDVVAGCACWCEVGDTVYRYHTTPGTEKVERQLKFPTALRPSIITTAPPRS